MTTNREKALAAVRKFECGSGGTLNEVLEDIGDLFAVAYEAGMAEQRESEAHIRAIRAEAIRECHLAVDNYGAASAASFMLAKVLP